MQAISLGGTHVIGVTVDHQTLSGT